jgi:hypothetical protein
VGYDNDQGFFLCKNSWGTTGGIYGSGFFKIAYGERGIGALPAEATMGLTYAASAADAPPPAAPLPLPPPRPPRPRPPPPRPPPPRPPQPRPPPPPRPSRSPPAPAAAAASLPPAARLSASPPPKSPVLAQLLNPPLARPSSGPSSGPSSYLVTSTFVSGAASSINPVDGIAPITVMTIAVPPDFDTANNRVTLTLSGTWVTRFPKAGAADKSAVYLKVAGSPARLLQLPPTGATAAQPTVRVSSVALNVPLPPGKLAFGTIQVNNCGWSSLQLQATLEYKVA